MHFLDWKYINLDWAFTEVCSQESNYQYSSIGSDDGHYLNHYWLVYWHIYASLSPNELIVAEEKGK